MKIELTDREAVVLRLALRFAAPQLAALNTTFADIWPGVVLVPPGDDEEQAVTPQEVGGLLCSLARQRVALGGQRGDLLL
jgi:hypothetical protein